VNTDQVTYSARGEEFVEEGIVTKTEPGKAYVLVPEKDECDDCSARIFCKSDTAKMQDRTLFVRDPLGVNTGDTVRIVIKGGTIVTASVFLYGLPFLVLVAMLFLGMEVFSSSDMPELWAFVLSVVGLGLYYLLLFVIGKQNDGFQAMPVITRTLPTT
jgi:positive regulator of sigma E activity